MLNNIINIYFHIATIGEYQVIYDELINKIIESNLIDRVDNLFVCIVGDHILKSVNHDKIKTINVGEVNEFEFPTLEKIENDILSTTDLTELKDKGVPIIIISADSKGSKLSDFKKGCEVCYDVCGVDWRTDPVPHFSGNFWWANSDYLKTLPKINTLNRLDSKIVLTLRHNAEMYIGMNQNVKPRILWQSNVSQYERHLHMYEESNYIGKINEENIIIH